MTAVNAAESSARSASGTRAPWLATGNSGMATRASRYAPRCEFSSSIVVVMEPCSQELRMGTWNGTTPLRVSAAKTSRLRISVLSMLLKSRKEAIARGLAAPA